MPQLKYPELLDESLMPERRIVEAIIRELSDLRDKALLATLYLTGARISELLELRRYDVKGPINYEGKLYLILHLVTLKRKEESLKLEGKKRAIPIPLDDPLTKYLLAWLEHVKNPEQPVFYSYQNPLEPITRQRAWQILKKADEKIWPHLLRHIRATELVTKYGFDAFRLRRWFQWSDLRPATRYTKLKVQDLLLEGERS